MTFQRMPKSPEAIKELINKAAEALQKKYPVDYENKMTKKAGYVFKFPNGRPELGYKQLRELKKTELDDDARTLVNNQVQFLHICDFLIRVHYEKAQSEAPLEPEHYRELLKIMTGIFTGDEIPFRLKEDCPPDYSKALVPFKKLDELALKTGKDRLQKFFFEAFVSMDGAGLTAWSSGGWQENHVIFLANYTVGTVCAQYPADYFA